MINKTRLTARVFVLLVSFIIYNAIAIFVFGYRVSRNDSADNEIYCPSKEGIVIHKQNSVFPYLIKSRCEY